MKTCGVVVEYNPFHNGHTFHLQEARRITGAEVIIAVMSGNFLQRGEPAIVDKWERAKVALLHGADMVIELPFSQAVQSADYFADGAIKILDKLMVDSLCFGTDSNTDFDYMNYAEKIMQNQDTIHHLVQINENENKNYPQLMEEILATIFLDDKQMKSTPNHILGLSYAKANLQLVNPMKLYPIHREGSGYHEKETYSSQFASATGIRKLIFNQQWQEIQNFISPEMFGSLQNSPVVSWENYWPLLRYKLISSSKEELQSIYQVEEGIENLLKEAAINSETYLSFIEKVKSKRYTFVKIQRICTYVLCSVTKTEMMQSRQNAYLRLLGCNSIGRTYLNYIKKEFDISVVSKISKKNKNELALDIKAGKVYRLGNFGIKTEDFGRHPIVLS